MAQFTVIVIITIALFGHLGQCGSPCPPFQTIQPCYCTTTDASQTFIICAGIQNSSQLVEATKAMKSMIVDRFIMLNVYRNPNPSPSQNEIASGLTERENLPTRWLASLRVKELEIQDASLSGCFLCDEPLAGQSDFLTSLVVTHSSLAGHLCTNCNPRATSVLTRELQKTPRLKHLDLSFNEIEVIDGFAFPPYMEDLKTILLSNNKIHRIHDNAFSSLIQLNDLDLSSNHLTTISRKIFRPSDKLLRVLDLSWNSLQVLPDDIFHNLSGLKEVKLSHNLLEVLPSSTWNRLPALIEKIDLKGNFLVCNCSLNWIGRRLSKTTKFVAKCVAPKEVETQDVKSTLSTLQSCS